MIFLSFLRKQNIFLGWVEESRKVARYFLFLCLFFIKSNMFKTCHSTYLFIYFN